MGISLEVKKFINSEYVGKFVELELPVEALPVKPEKEKKEKKKFSLGRKRDDDDYDDDIEEELDREEQQAKQVKQPEPAPVGPSYEKVRIHYVEDGVGEPLILVHSIGQSIYTWRNLYNRLVLNYRVIAIDLPGHGYSSRPESFAYTIEEQAHIIELFMDAVNVRSAHFMAFSMGSAYVLKLAYDHPERIGKMLLIAPGGMSSEMPLALRMLDSSIFGSVASMLYGLRTVEKVLSECYFDLTVTMGPEVVSEYYKTVSDRESRRALRDSFHNFDDAEIVGRLRSLEVPALMMQGSEDKWRTAEQAELYHAAMPYAGYATVRNAGHLLHEEKADKVIAALLEYIPAVQPEA